MGTMVLRKTTPYLVKCDLCKKVTHHVYNIVLGGMNYKFCSDMHANTAAKNFQTNIDENKQPSIVLETVEEEGGESLGFAE